MDVKLNFMVSREERDKLERMAKQERRTMSNLLRKWINEHADQELRTDK